MEQTVKGKQVLSNPRSGIENWFRGSKTKANKTTGTSWWPSFHLRDVPRKQAKGKSATVDTAHVGLSQMMETS